MARRFGSALVKTKDSMRGTGGAYLSFPPITKVSSRRAFGLQSHSSRDLAQGLAPVRVVLGIEDLDVNGRIVPYNFRCQNYMITSVARTPSEDFDFIAAATLGVSYGEYARYAEQLPQGQRQFIFGPLCDGFNRPELFPAIDVPHIFVSTEGQHRLLTDDPSDAWYHQKLQEALAEIETFEQVAG